MYLNDHVCVVHMDVGELWRGVGRPFLNIAINKVNSKLLACVCSVILLGVNMPLPDSSTGLSLEIIFAGLFNDLIECRRKRLNQTILISVMYHSCYNLA